MRKIRSGLSFPLISGKVWLAFWSVLILACLGFGIATRMGYTDFNAHPDQVASMPYRYAPANHQAVALAVDKTHDDGTLDVDGLFDKTPVIVKGVFEGDRAYGYQTFVSGVRITQVYRGDGLTAGQVIPLFEQIQIGRDPGFELMKQNSPDTYNAFVKKFDLAADAQAPYDMRPSGGDLTFYLRGGTPMRTGREYLFFLAPKTYPSVEDRTGKPQEYLMENSPYARVAIPVAGATSDVGLPNPQADFLTFDEAQRYSFIINGASDPATLDHNPADDLDLYEQTCDEILKRVESLQP